MKVYNYPSNAAEQRVTRIVSRGLAFGDIDGDGDVDLAEGTLSGIRLYRNDTVMSDKHWLQVRAITGNRDAIGARLILDTGGDRMLRMVLPAYSYASSSDPRVHFGLRAAPASATLEVSWPDGATERFAVTGVDRHLTVRQGTGTSL